MSIPDPFEPESPHIDTRMFEFVERRREEQARARRQRIQLVAIVALGLIGIGLTVSNAILVSRLLARPVTPPAVAPPPVRSGAPVTPVDREPAAASSEPAAAAAPEAPSAAPALPGSTTASRLAGAPTSREPSSGATDSESASQEPVRQEPVTRESAAPADAQPSLPERATRTPSRAPSRAVPPASARPPAPRESPSTAAETDPALRTARWMIRTYGPLEAESKALAAAQFYKGEDGAYWRRVVAHVRAER